MSRIEYICHASSTGYSQSARDYVASLLDHTNHDIKLAFLYGDPLPQAFTPERYEQWIDLSLKSGHPDAVQIFHCIPHQQMKVRRRLKKTVGFAVFETFDPPPLWVHLLNQNTEVICPSSFCKTQFERSGVTRPISVIPHCIDTNIFNVGVKPLREHNTFTFLYFATWFRRKGWPQLIEAWIREFGPTDKVQLIIKTDKIEQAVADIDKLKVELDLMGKEHAPILMEDTIFDEVHLAGFMKSADCLVFPTLGEGFGLPPMQCMAVGTPVICTDFSGCTEFVSEDTATVLKPDGFLRHCDLDGFLQLKNKIWAHIPIQSIRNAMRFVLENVDVKKRKAQTAADMVAHTFSYQKVAQQFNDLVERIHGST